MSENTKKKSSKKEDQKTKIEELEATISQMEEKAAKDKDDYLKNYVLGRFSKADMDTLKNTMEKAVDALKYILDGDTDGAMSRYNG